MRNDLELDAIIEDYLLGKLNPQETEAFEQLRQNDATVDHKVVSHKFFLESMEAFAGQVRLREQLNHIHAEIDVESLADALRPHPSRVVQLWRKHKSAIAVAASFIVLSLVSIYSIQHNSKQVERYRQLSNQVNNAIKTQNSLIRKINHNNTASNKSSVQNSFGGTGFAISTNGYILTNLHIINGADSLYVQNNKGESFKVKSVYTDSQNDIAILKISDKHFSNLSAIPYTIKSNMSSIGEIVYTWGYPKDDAVLGEGYVSSRNGFIGDTTQYQVAISVNPGNSGGPVLDNNGNLVGIISGKPDQTEGAAFAIKSKYILEAIRAIPQDSLGSNKLTANKRSLLSGLKRTKQIEKIQDYVFMIKAY
ncbi:trypsin-like serine protease [Pedobacter sp. HDW13]|uniref:S1C family serine protease n=1 Tax=unclassified Pedobacter TaxID=2628915 RepID=UPI000F59CD37|nr:MULTISPECIES: S1C family serine protease [unclassified Pedobacter]QIL41473.1 trypsin-like serine protease [Pedobacter sp. HDW13]RQO77950.1 serine protease [Pedobacter sp. KBW01]